MATSKLSLTTTSKLFFAAAMAVLISALIATVRLQFSFPSQKENLSGNEFQRRLQIAPIACATGPESFAFDALGEGPYTGVSDGRIIKREENRGSWIDFAVTSPERDGCGGLQDHSQTEHICGRPLGLRFNQKTGDLYIADAYMGLLLVGPNGGLAAKIATQAEGIPFGFTNSLDIDEQGGAVYFTDSSSRYQRRNYVSLILSGDRTGRLMKYDPEIKQVQVLLNDLSFPNGVALSQDGNFLLLAETTKCRILKYWLKTPKTGSFEVFAQLPGFPDNIKRSCRGGYWVGITRREKSTELVLSYPWIGNALLKLPLDFMKIYSFMSKWRGSGYAVRVGENGEILEVFEDKIGNRWRSVSEVEEKDGSLWIGSVTMPFVGKYKL